MLGEITVSRHFITFRPTTGIFDKAIQPYRKWYEKSDMSPPLEVDGKYYRILRTTGMFDKVSTRKAVIADEGGRLIKDEELTRECSKIFVYLTPFQVNSQGIIASSKEDTDVRLDKFIVEFKKILENIASHLTEKELEAMKFHLYYYEETKRLVNKTTKEAHQLLPYAQKLKENRIEVFSSSIINKLEHHIAQWETNKRYVEALMIEDGLKARNIVRKILRNTEYQPYFPNKQITEKMVEETYEAEKAVKRFIYDGKQSWKYESKWLSIDREEFTVEKLLYNLRYQNVVELYKKLTAIEILQNHWIFSPKCLYL